MNNKIKITVMDVEGAFWTEELKDKFAHQAYQILEENGLSEDANEFRVSQQCSKNEAGKLVCRVYLCYKSVYKYTSMDAVFDELHNLIDLYSVIEK